MANNHGDIRQSIEFFDILSTDIGKETIATRFRDRDREIVYSKLKEFIPIIKVKADTFNLSDPSTIDNNTIRYSKLLYQLEDLQIFLDDRYPELKVNYEAEQETRAEEE